MQLSFLTGLLALVGSIASQPLVKRDDTSNNTIEQPTANGENLSTGYGKSFALFKPQVFVISMFFLEEEPWQSGLEMVHNITLPGLSPLYSQVHCVANYTICQFTTGEGEINAASSVTALLLSPLFDFSETYFLIAGIAGGEPHQITLGSATFARFAVQAGLEYQIDSKEVPAKYDWPVGYYAFDTTNPFQYPAEFYGTEVFELNTVLRDRALFLAQQVELSNGTSGNEEFRALYDYAPANEAPKAVACDTLTSDVYWVGNVLSDYFVNFTSLITNGTGVYCATQQEDNASLEAFTRASLHGLVDFSRIVVLRTISDFARAPPVYSNDTVNFFNNVSQGGSHVAIENIWLAGLPFVQDVISNWDTYYKNHYFKPTNYIGDVFGTLGGQPDFGTY